MAKKPPKAKNLLAKQPEPEDPGDSPYEIPFEYQMKFADSLLDFSSRMVGVSNTLLHEMMGKKSETGMMTFKTRNGRKCLMVLVVGDEDVDAFVKALT